MADGINLRLRRRDMNVFRTIDQDGRRPVAHVAGKHPVALCPSCSRPSVTTNGTGWRDVIDAVCQRPLARILEQRIRASFACRAGARTGDADLPTKGLRSWEARRA